MGRPRTPTEKVELGEQARAMRAAGKSRREIVAALKVGEDLLDQLLRGTAVPESLRRPRAKDDQRALARQMYAAGQSYREIERELGVAKSSLSLWLRDLKAARDEPLTASVSGKRATELDAVGMSASGADSRIELARELRLEGQLLKQIAQGLGVSTVTVHRWTRDLPVPPSARPGRDPEHMHRMRRAYWDPVLAEREEERQAVMAAAAGQVDAISPRELFLLGVVAYWCEGTKSKSWRRMEFLRFINSDPGLILLFLAFLKDQGVQDSQLRLSVSIHESADVAAAERYWAELVGIPVEEFRPATLKRHNPKTVRKNVGETYVGCLTIGVRQSRELYQRIAGAWQGIMAGVAAATGAAA